MIVTLQILLRNATKVYRQGELLFVPDLDVIETDLEVVKSTIVRRGSTGGNHTVPQGSLLRAVGGSGTTRWVRPGNVTHKPTIGKAHNTLALPAGVAFYRVVIQSETSPTGVSRYVMD